MDASVPGAREFIDLWRSLGPVQKILLANQVKSSKAYLSQLAHGKRTPSVAMIRRLVCADERLHAEMFIPPLEQ